MRTMRTTVRAALAVATALLLILTVAACGSGTPPAPTQVPSAPTKATEPTKSAAAAPAAPTAVPAAQPTAVPAKKVDFPEKGKTLTLLVAFPAGGGVDVSARALAPHLEKELGIPVQVVNRPGAASQVGLTDLFNAKPDGYTIGYTNLPATILLYLDPDRKSTFTRKSIQPLALHTFDVGILAVKASSPYKTMKDLVDAAKANPEKIKVASTGILSAPHIGIINTQQVTGAKFAIVQFDGSPQTLTALLGDHVDAQFAYTTDDLPQIKSGDVRVLGVMDKEESKYLPGVKTMEAQGYKIYNYNYRGISMPAGAPKEVVDTLSAAIKRAMDAPEHKQKMEEMAYTLRYMDPAQFASTWDSMESEVKPLIDLAKK